MIVTFKKTDLSFKKYTTKYKIHKNTQNILLNVLQNDPQNLPQKCSTKGGQNKSEEVDEEKIEIEENECEDKESEDNESERVLDKFDFIMTFDKKKFQRHKLPQEITLTKSFPGENPVMRKRNFPAALRFHKKYKATDPVRYMFSEVILYFPHKTEMTLEDAPDFFEESFEGERKVDIIKSQVMEYLQDVTEARNLSCWNFFTKSYLIETPPCQQKFVLLKPF